ncbi:hypothetical protein MASR2M48_12980 [Spirochaetota bacterium]
MIPPLIKPSVCELVFYLLRIDFERPNNDPKTATSVTLGQTVYPAIYPRGDQDWYTVEVKKQGYIRLIPRDIPKGIGLEARFCIYDEWDGLKVIRDWSKLPTGCPVQSGVYHFCIGDDWSGFGVVDKAFPMLIEFLDEMDLAEPNNVPKDAKAFLPGETKTMAVYPVGDLDYYSLTTCKGWNNLPTSTGSPAGYRSKGILAYTQRR